MSAAGSKPQGEPAGETRTVLVVGGSGFIGSRLVAHLDDRNYRVIATTRGPVDDQTDGVEFRHLDLAEGSNIECRGIDTVIYLAARAHVLREDSHDPLAAYRAVNRDGALAVAGIAREQGVRRFVYLSSIGVNGVVNDEPFRETDVPAPVEDYARSKLEAEQALAGLCAESAMELVLLRPVLVYGRGAPGNFARLVEAVRAGRWLPVGGFDNRRSLVSVSNLVEFIELCIRHPDAADELFLVADGDDVSTPQLARLIGDAIGRRARLLYLPLWLLRPLARLLGKTREVERVSGSLQVDIDKARQQLGWRPSQSLREGLRELR